MQQNKYSFLLSICVTQVSPRGLSLHEISGLLRGIQSLSSVDDFKDLWLRLLIQFLLLKFAVKGEVLYLEVIESMKNHLTSLASLTCAQCISFFQKFPAAFNQPLRYSYKFHLFIVQNSSKSRCYLFCFHCSLALLINIPGQDKQIRYQDKDHWIHGTFISRREAPAFRFPQLFEIVRLDHCVFQSVGFAVDDFIFGLNYIYMAETANHFVNFMITNLFVYIIVSVVTLDIFIRVFIKASKIDFLICLKYNFQNV